MAIEADINLSIEWRVFGRRRYLRRGPDATAAAAANNTVVDR